MSGAAEDHALLPQLKRVLLELRDTRRRLADLESRDLEPIAIVGMGCRFAGGANSPEELWDLVAEGRDAIREFPADRGWDLDQLFDPDPSRPTTCYTRNGGFLDDADLFDADLFSIPPREALAMDPQQRLLLEATWEAFEHAGIDPTSVKGESIGTYVGIGGTDYGMSVLRAPELEGFRMTGTLVSLASGRVAYTFGLEGPAVSIDTACSSSLVALHLACQALRRGECDQALVAGTTVFSSPALIVDFSRQRLLSTDGRCKAFGAGADGAGFSDGVGVLLLERLSRAREKGHEVLAMIRGSAVNQDGASNGLIAPNGPSQKRVIRDALANAGLSPADIDVVEGHGTGTALGDPIEIQALLDTYGQERSNGPLWLGSIKSNIGHTSTAAGVAGVIKMVQALRHERLPRSLHCEQPSPHVDWSEGEVELLREAVDWPPGERPRRAGVSSFGISGTNAHVILEEAPRENAAPEADGTALAAGVGLPFVVSAAGGEALAAQAGRLAGFLESRPQQGLAELATALAVGRAHLSHRAALVANERGELIAALRALERGELRAGSVRSIASDLGAVAMLFAGQGSQRAQMGARLYEEFPVFAAALDDACGHLEPLLERPLLDVMFAEPRSAEAALLSDTRFTQVALFALEVALFRLLESFRVRPDVLIGHSVGEFAAAHVAGVFSLADGCRLVAERARLMSALPAGGAMLAVVASEEEIAESLVGFEGRVSLAAINGPSAATVSGEADALGELEALWRERGRKTTRLDVSHAFHSHLMEPMLAELKAVADGVTLSAPEIPVISNVSGRQLTAQEACSAEYWVRHVREPVRFADGVEFLTGSGVTCFLEIGPSTVLAALAASSPAAESGRAVFASVLRGAKVREPEALLGFLAAAHCSGVPVDWRVLFNDAGVGRVELPTYAFQRRRYWLEPEAESDPAAIGQLAGEHPLLGAAVRLAGAEGWLLTGRLSLAAQPWLADHALGGVVLLPATAFVELALAAAQRVQAAGLEDLTLVAPLVLESGGGGVSVQVSVAEPDEEGRRAIDIYSARQSRGEEEEGGSQWTLHATGLLAAPDAEQLDAPSLGSWPPASAQEVDVECFYETLAEAGYDYGPAFRGLRAAWREENAWLAEVQLGEAEQADAAGFHAHPALVDAALHVALLAAVEQGAIETPAVPFSFAGVRVHSSGTSSLRVRVEIEQDEQTRTIALTAADDTGQPALTIDQLQARPLDHALLEATVTANQPLYRLTWTRLEPEDAPKPRMALVGGSEVPIEGIELDCHPDLASLERAIADGAPAPDVVLTAAPPGRGTPPADTHAVTTCVLGRLQAWLASEELRDARLVVLTDRALTVLDGEEPNLAHAAVPGLVRSAASEDPMRFGLVDGGSSAGVPGLALALSTDEPELALRDGALFAPRLARAAVEDERPVVGYGTDGVVVITGGTGGLGAVVARHLASRHGVRRLVLTSRRGLEADGAAALVAELRELECHADVFACDVTDREQLQALFSGIEVIGVVHAAGVLDDAMIGSLDAGRLRSVMAPKVDGALHLHELTADRRLSFFVLFSSAAAVLGSPGQGSYAAANAFLDGLAHHRQAHGLPAVSVAWGPWRQAAGMVAGADPARLARVGIELLSDEQALSLLDVALEAPDPHLVPICLEAGALRSLAGAGALPPILSGLVRKPARRGVGGKGALARMLAQAPESEWERIALDLIRGHVAAVLGHPSPQAIDPHRNFRDMGFDSLAAVELRNLLIRATGLRLPATVVFDHPTPSSAARYLIAKVASAQRSPSAAVRPSTASDEPIAIVGMSCRYPGGVRSPEDLWRLVVEGRDAIGEFPGDRGWDVERLFHPDPERLGTSYTRHGGFVYDAGEFDAAFFSMGPREALATDPQQRLLLEATWEALEHACIDPESLRKSETGVFTGVMYQDYAFGGYGNSGDLEGWLAVGSAGSVVSGRIAYAFGFEGPAVTVDTACSSSLVTLHLACQALRSGESSLAIAGGVTVLSHPMLFVEFSRQRGLSPDGRCKSFGAGADGVGWAEGAGLVVLERLSDARRLGHPVLAVVRGSAVNQDGASNGLAAPNGPSQERVIRRALANAGLSPADVDVVEGHGTGTTLGDPIEAQALLEAYGRERSNGPLLLGSIKSNIGHTQAAAGVAGVIKMVQAIRHGLLPRSLHCERPSPHVDWSGGQIELLTEAVQWRAGERPRRAGVSSFGISGTNAHVILEEPPASLQQGAGAGRAAEPRARLPLMPLLISGRGMAGLRGQAARLHEWLEAEPELDARDVGYSLVTTRTQLEQRAVVLGSSREDLVAGLGALAAGEPASTVITGEAQFGMTAFLFTGQGAQRPGMGAGLYREFPVFARALDALCAELEPKVGRSLQELMFAAEGSAEAELLERTEFTQASVFALEVALYRLLESHGVCADRLVGHSIGELAAAHVAGVLSLADACALVAARGRLMAALPAGGAMLAIEASEQEVAETLTECSGVSLAAVNGPRAVVVSGEAEAIEAVETLWGQRARKASRLAVSHAFHSHLMEPMLDEFRAIAAGLSFRAPRIPIVSNLTGAEVCEELCDPDYWVAHVREPVRFADGLRELERLGVTRFVEIGPDAVLSALARGSVSDELVGRGLFAPTLRRDRDEVLMLITCLGALSTRGANVDWPAYFQQAGARRVELPTYAFQRERYWLAPVNSAGDVAAAGLGDVDHPMLGAAVPAAATDEWLFTATWSLATHPWVADHAVFDTVLMPGTGFAELALRVAGEVGCEAIEELTIEAPLLFPEQGAVQVQVAVGEPDPGGRREIAIYSRLDAEHAEDLPDWTRHASGLLTSTVAGSGEALAERLAREPWPPPGAERIDTDDLYDRLAESGYAYGPVFQGVTAAWRRGEEVFAEVSLDSDSARHASDFGIHPALFDAAFHALLGLLSEGLEPGHVPLPFLWSGVRLLRAGTSSLRVSVQPTGEDALRVTALDETGAPTLLVETVMARTIDVTRMASAQGASASSLFVLDFAEVPLGASNDDAPCLAVIGDVPGAPADAKRYADLAELGAELDAGAVAPHVVLAGVGGGRNGDDARAVHDVVQRALALLQAWLASDALTEARLVLVTHGAVAVLDGELPELAAAAVWGLTRSAAAENPGRIVSLDLEVGGDQPLWLPLLAADEPQLAVRSGVAHAPRFARPSAGPQTTPPMPSGGTILVTGGTGGLGALVARHLAEGGARHLLLASRRGPEAEGAGELAAQLAELGCETTLAACDFGDRDAVAELLASIPDECPLTAVVHTAGVMEDGTIPSLAPDQVDRVLRPKVDASLHLHELTKELDLSDFILFSSAAPLLGGAGQGSYAAANAVLDALAQRRYAQGLPARSMAWGLWSVASGMAGVADADFESVGRAIRARLGLVPMPADLGLELFESARSVDAPLVMAARLDSGVLRGQARAGSLPAVLRGLMRAVARRDRAAGGAIAERLAGRSREERDAILLEIIRAELAAVLGHESATAIDPDRSILELGLDSLGAVELRNRLAHSTGVRIAPTVAFETPTPRQLATHLSERLGERADGAEAAAADANGSAGTLMVLLRQAHEQGLLGDFMPILAAASRFRPAFQSPRDLAGAPPLVPFSRGEGAELICVPSFLAGSGPHQFARLAAGFPAGRKLSAFSLPGFRSGERVPATWEAAVEALAVAVADQASEGAFVLAGYSIGGALAHALARRLEDDGLSPAGLVLIDTYAPERQDEMAAVFGEVMGSVLEQRHQLIEAAVDDDNLVAMGTYARLMAEWEPLPIDAPRLLLRASEPLGDAYERGGLPWWQLPPEVIEVSGHHFELIGGSAAATAAAIDAWVKKVEDLRSASR
jgi:acyl transferase domain-containing protein/thioesterase domain-containing protein/acyl carrier protein